MAQYKYKIVVDELRRQIQTGEYSVGERLPGEFEQVARFQVSRQTIRKAMSQLESEGYLIQKQGSGTFVADPNSAVSKPQQQTMTIAVLCPYISDYIFPSIIRGIEQVLSENGYNLQLAATKNRVDNERIMLQRCLDNAVDGLIVGGTKTTLPNPNIGLYEEVRNRKIPIVFFNANYRELQDTVLVDVDDMEGGRQAVEYLASRGHTKIAGVFKSDDSQGLKRYAGFNEGLRQAGLEINDHRIKWYTTFDRDESEYFQSGVWVPDFLDDATAVVCYNDIEAVWLAGVLEAHGLRVPEDVTLVSFDNSALCHLSGKKITTFGHPKEKMGKLAAQKIINMIQGKQEESARFPWQEPEFLP